GMAQFILKACHDTSTQLFVLEKLIEAEFEFAKADWTTFMRERSRLPNRATGNFVLNTSRTYLHNTLAQLVEGVMAKRMEVYEIDPEKRPKTLESNIAKLSDLVRLFMDHIMSDETLDLMPLELRALCATVARLAPRYGFGAHILPLVGNLIFLRFLNPGIAVPEFYGVSVAGKTPSQRARRNLILITKVIQSISNGVRFGDSEQFMIPMNTVVDEYMPRCEAYLRKVITDPTGQDWKGVSKGLCPLDTIQMTEYTLRELAIAHRALSSYRDFVMAGVMQDIESNSGQGICTDFVAFRTSFDELLYTLGATPVIGPEPYTDRVNPRPKEYAVTKVNRKNKRQERVIKFTPSSLLNIERKPTPNPDKLPVASLPLTYPAIIKNEMMISEISEITAPPHQPVLIIAFDNDAKVETRVGYFPADKGDRAPRIYECASVRQRDEILGELFEICFSWWNTEAPSAYEVTKINRKGKAQSRVFKLSKDSLMNLDGTKIKTERHYSELDTVRAGDMPLEVWIKFYDEEETRKNILLAVEDRDALLLALTNGMDLYEDFSLATRD
ncbi:hypothetical protein KIPB_000627, partial [Kipferlia bialata]